MRTDEVINKLGDGKLKVTARVLGLPFPTLQHWKRTNRVPTWRQDHVRKIARLKGVDLEEKLTA